MEATRSEPTAQNECVHRDRPDRARQPPPRPPTRRAESRARSDRRGGAAARPGRPQRFTAIICKEEKGETARFEGGRAAHLGAPDRPSSHPHHLCGGFSNLGEDGSATMSRSCRGGSSTNTGAEFGHGTWGRRGIRRLEPNAKRRRPTSQLTPATRVDHEEEATPWGLGTKPAT